MHGSKLLLHTKSAADISYCFDETSSSENEIVRIIEDRSFHLFFKHVKQKIFVSGERLNDLRFINRYLKQINSKLETGDDYFGFFETFSARKHKLFINKIPIVRNLYFFFDFLLRRVIPKTKYLNVLYFSITKGKNRLLSKAEVLGRLVCAGFSIEEVENIGGLCYFRAKKISENDIRKTTSYGMIFKMKRVGKNGKLFYVYKFRTMHPFSEYLQDYMLEKHGLASNGKIEDDFRMTPWGRWMRKHWIDELPQLLNVFKGEMKLVGVRPVTPSYFNKLPADLQTKRIKYKPGCIPPYVSMNVKSSFESVIESENNYLEKKIKNPYTTDLKFFFYALINIFIKGKRSA